MYIITMKAVFHFCRFAQTYRDGSHYFVLLILTDGVITDMPQTKQAIVAVRGKVPAKVSNELMEKNHWFPCLDSNPQVLLMMDDMKESDDWQFCFFMQASVLPMSIIIIGIGDADFGGKFLSSSLVSVKFLFWQTLTSALWAQNLLPTPIVAHIPTLVLAAMEQLDADDMRLFAAGQYAERDIVQFVPFRDFIGGRYGQNLQLGQAHLAKEVLAEVPDQITGYMKKHGIKPLPASSRKPGPGHGIAAPQVTAAPASAPPATTQPPSAPPPGQYAPPAGQYPPPGGQYPPPGGQYPPPGGQYPPPGGQYASASWTVCHQHSWTVCATRARTVCTPWWAVCATRANCTPWWAVCTSATGAVSTWWIQNVKMPFE